MVTPTHTPPVSPRGKVEKGQLSGGWPGWVAASLCPDRLCWPHPERLEPECRPGGGGVLQPELHGQGPVLQRVTQISTVPFVDESSGSDDDCSSQASVQSSVPCSEPRKTSGLGSPRAIKRGMEQGS